jgi:DNA mismatch repair protein MutL
MQYLFVNGRWVRDRSLGHAVQEAYRGLLMTGRYAVSFLFLTMPPDQVDVNVHPTKAEVRFRNPQALHHLIYTAVKQRLREANLVPRLQAPAAPAPAPVPVPVPVPVPAPASAPPVGGGMYGGASYFPAPPSSYVPVAPRPSATTPRQPALPLPPFVPPEPVQTPPPAPEPRPASPVAEIPPNKVLQLYDCYIVVETERGMLVIDQHALHERILFEQFRSRIRGGSLQTQNLLIPEPIDLRPEQAGRLLEQREALADLGLGVEDFGGGTVLLTRYPALLGQRSPRQALLSVVDYLSSEDRLPAREVLFNQLLSLMACHAAVRAGERLTAEQMLALLAQRDLAEDVHHCPHGRPTSLLFSRQELEKQIRRV